MDKQQSGSSPELQCIGRLEIARPKPVGFLCGSIPVPTDKAFHGFDSAALVPSPHTVRAPRYRLIPTETDLNMPPFLSSIPEKVLPIAAARSRLKTGENMDLPRERGTITSNLTRKGEALAVSGLAEYGDEVDIIGPADILKQIFKIPYSKARLSVAVHRVGQTLILNTGPDTEEGEKLIRRHTQSKCADQSLFLNFAMHSVRMEACDCPPTHQSSASEQSDSSVLPEPYNSRKESVESPDDAIRGQTSFSQSSGVEQEDRFDHQQSRKEKLYWGKKKNNRNKSQETVKKVAQVNKQRCSVQESEKYRRVSNNGFLRVLFWQFHNFRMLLGSDLLIFSNEKYVAVSLHLWDVSRPVTPLTWLEAWLDNVMASVPELAICYHQDGVVQGYELLKTDDIFLLKGVSEDGIPAFHPHVVQQNGLSVLRFLQENCKQDPASYWLYKSAGEDVIQLFDLSVIPKSHSADSCDDDSDSLPSLIHRGRSDSMLSLGTLLYRTAHRLSLSMSPNNRARCARFFKKCLDFLDEPDHLVVRAFAHEQFARLLLTYNEDLGLPSEELPVKCQISIADSEEESFEFFSGLSESSGHGIISYPILQVEPSKTAENLEELEQENSTEVGLNGNISSIEVDKLVLAQQGDLQSSEVVSDWSRSPGHAIQTIADPISSKLAAVHHVSQAIKSLRWTRQLQSTRTEMNLESKIEDEMPSAMDFSVCACGDADCIEVCDIREWLRTSKLDDKVWKLVLLLGESYLALGQAYKDDEQLYQALKVVELACLVYGSMPQDTKFISSMACSSLTRVEVDAGTDYDEALAGDDCFTIDQLSSNYLFWARAWTLVGDVFVEFHLIKGKEVSVKTEWKSSSKELRMSSEVLKEVERLKKKLGQFSQNCSLCSLVNCSCQSDRASSGSSASSSARDTHSLGYGRKQSRKAHGKSSAYSHSGDHENNFVSDSGGGKRASRGKYMKSHDSSTVNGTPDLVIDATKRKNLVDVDCGRVDASPKSNATDYGMDSNSKTTSEGQNTKKIGGIFKYIRGSITGDVEHILCVASDCYEEARKALSGLPSSSTELQSVTKKKGWVCNELGRSRLEREDLGQAEIAFAEAINSFKEVEDHTNIILINCNLGHGKRALAEELVSKIESLKKHAALRHAYKQALETAKAEYSESLRYYGAAKAELNAFADVLGSVASSLRNEVYTQFAHTYLRLGMLLAREDTVAEVYENGILEAYTRNNIDHRERRKHEISANDAIREALAGYESLGELRKQEAAYAHFQLACYQRDCCLKFLELDQQKNNLAKTESNVVHRVKQYASLADRNWQKAMDFYGPNTHPVMYLTILIERSALSYGLSSSLHSNALLESALSRMLEACHIPESASLSNNNPEICAKFWGQLQMQLKSMLSMTLSTKANKSLVNSQPIPSNKSLDVKKLRELYKMSLNSTDFQQLHAMHSLWTS